MINFSKIKYVLFDFDETLCVHSNHSDYDFSEIEYETKLLMKCYKWKNSSSNIHLKEFIQLCKAKNIKMGLLGHVDSVNEAREKVEWVKTHYGVELENFCVGTREFKVLELEAIANANNYLNDEILIIDDLTITLSEAAQKGFQNATPMEIVNFIEITKNRLGTLE